MDKIDLVFIVLGTTPVLLDGGDAFSAAGEVEMRIGSVGRDSVLVEVDANGDGATDVSIRLNGVDGLDLSDFLF
jgi:hypothetical protein